MAKQKLMTAELEKKFAEIGTQDGDDPKQFKIVAKYFCPWNQWTWYATEYDPESKIFYGFVRGAEEEWGSFSLEELDGISCPFGMFIERDLHFENKTIGDVL